MIKSKIVLLSALVSCALISGCKEENKTNVSIEFMHSSVEQERQAVISKLIARFEKENPGITVKQVPVEEDAYNTKVITLSRSGSLPEVIETSHDYAKVMDKEQLIDRKAVATVISNVGEGAFYDGVLRIVRTEDGSAWTGVPVSAWIGGIWYRKDVLAKAGLEEPKNWQQLLDVAQKLNDPANKKYGIALPTAESVLTEQSFSQFALSNQANVFNAEGKITLDTPEMMQALTYYRDLAANTMPGSNDIMEVKDAFMNGTAPMAIYSTYILPAVIKEGDPKNVGFVVPTEKNSAVYQDHMINTLADARRYIVENDLKHVQIIGDFYHMNIEEDNLAQALHDNRDLLGHVHIADNHRYQPGSGTLDFHALFEQLRADNYQGYVVYEGRIRAEDPAQAYRDSLAWLRTC
ncbi:extracellular solute-binding protein [Escherichia coli]|uniref:extracellular solute-binding protein n=16 Tax=Enterobacterales TaxID=91347 RepID=UPI0010B30D57|nr:extracellular solute-binding protein [Escherichia coli]WNT79518.1 hypothetical protein QMY50_03037 [Escherichia coli]GCK30553.1 ABC sugar transporter periplasmic binding protein [Escherichia coli]